MRKTKRWLAFLLSLSMVLSVGASPVLAASAHDPAQTAVEASAQAGPGCRDRRAVRRLLKEKTGRRSRQKHEETKTEETKTEESNRQKRRGGHRPQRPRSGSGESGSTVRRD